MHRWWNFVRHVVYGPQRIMICDFESILLDLYEVQASFGFWLFMLFEGLQLRFIEQNGLFYLKTVKVIRIDDFGPCSSIDPVFMVNSLRIRLRHRILYKKSWSRRGVQLTIQSPIWQEGSTITNEAIALLVSLLAHVHMLSDRKLPRSLVHFCPKTAPMCIIHTRILWTDHTWHFLFLAVESLASLVCLLSLKSFICTFWEPILKKF